MINQCYIGDVRDGLSAFAAAGILAQTCVTSPPYWGGLRDYGVSGQIGLERDPDQYVSELVKVFRMVRDILEDSGTLWLNVGDVYAASGKGGGGSAGNRSSWDSVRERRGFRMPPDGFKMKDLTLTPFRLAEALRSDGWYLRQTIIWRKPSAVEPMRSDRPATSHEYVFLLSKREHYFTREQGYKWWGSSVWDISSDRDGLHPAAMPFTLAARCIAAGSVYGDIVIDPFMGSGTTALAAQNLGRRWIGCELNEDYVEIQAARLAQSSLGIDHELREIGGDYGQPSQQQDLTAHQGKE